MKQKWKRNKIALYTVLLLRPPPLPFDCPEFEVAPPHSCHPTWHKYNEWFLSRNKPDVKRKGFEMAGTVEAVTKELQPEYPA